MNVGNVAVHVAGLDMDHRLTEKGLKNQEDVIKRVRDTFTPTKDSFEKMTEQSWKVCDCYTNYQITVPMPKHLFGDSFGYDMQKDVETHMSDFYAGRIDKRELDQYFSDCCTEMRKYQVQKHWSTGNVDEDNRKIISEVYEIFAKENARAARRANYDEGAKLNAEYGYRNYDWVYYNADYYYQCADVRESLGTMANEIAQKWGSGSIDTEEIEKNSDLTLDGGFDFNSGWNFSYRNQVGRASMADESLQPPRDFRFFYKEDVDNVSKMDMWINGRKYEKDIPFYITPDSLEGQLFQADEIWKEHDEQIDNVRGYSDFMSHLSLFTGWYAWSTGINNHFGNYIPENTYWNYG